VASACLDEARAAAFAAHELSADERAEVIAHAEGCDECRRVLAALLRRDGGADWNPGTRVGRYIVREKIGRGGMGAVWRAEDLELDRPVALKRLHADADREARARLVREARAAAQLQHPNVVAVYEVSEAEGEPFLAMELVEGETFAGWLRTPRPWHQIVDMLVQAGRGLAAAHARGLVHRDFKPENVLIDHEGRARVVDFGLARAGDTPVPKFAHAGALVALTQTGVIAGTPAYLAPELVEGAPPDERSDQYAFAITCFEALHGMHPFVGASADVIWAEMAAGRIRDGRRDVPARLDRLARRGLAVDPAARWPSVAALVDALAARRRRRWPWIVAGGAIAVANLIVVLALRKPFAPECSSGADVADRVWNASVRDEQTRRLAHIAPGRRGAIETSSRLTDDWVAAWRLGHEAACHADAQVRAARFACLDLQLEELSAQLLAWTSASPRDIDHVVSSVMSLPRPEQCSLSTANATHVSATVRARLAAFSAMSKKLRHGETIPLIPSLLAAAEASGDAGTVAHVLLAAGVVESDVGDRERGREDFAHAVQEGAKAGDDEVAIEALLHEAGFAVQDDRPVEALGLCDAAEALVARAKVVDDHRIHIVRADALAAFGRLPEAIAAYRRALALLEPRAALDRHSRLELAYVLTALGNGLGRQGEVDDAIASIQRALEIEQAELGPEDPTCARTMHDLANREVKLAARVEDARRHFEQARAALVAAYGPRYEEVALCDVGLADVARAQHRPKEAMRLLESALAGLRPTHRNVSEIERDLGQLARELDDPAGSIPHFRRAIEAYVRLGITGGAPADAHSGLALSLVELDRYAEARGEAELSLAEYDAAGAEPSERVDAWNVLAVVEHQAHHDAAAIEYERKVVDALRDVHDPALDALREFADANIRVWSR
jgi:tetratricopeptide (TPR) repeat protein